MRGYKRLGRKRWQKHVEKVVTLLKHGLQADYVMLGGGQAKHLKGVPPGARLGSNANAMSGGVKVWERAARRSPEVGRPRRRRAQTAARPSGTEPS